MYEKRQKTDCRMSAIILKPMKIFISQFDTIISKPVTTMCVSFEFTEKYRVKERYGWAGQVIASDAERSNLTKDLLSTVIWDFQKRDMLETIDFFDMVYRPYNRYP